MKDIKILQNKILEIAVYFDEFCKKHGIVYYLMGGSALGAIRHKGFIPWDDDFDVFMTYDNYEKFLSCAKEYLDEDNYYLQAENTEEWPLYFSKLRMNNTLYVENTCKNRKMHQGIYIDIMCINNAPDINFFVFLQYVAAKMLVAKTLYKRGYDGASKRKNAIMKIAFSIISDRFEGWLIKYVRKFNDRKTKRVVHFFGKAPYKKSFFPVDFLGEARYVPFENTFLPVPEKVEEYLASRFGDYNKLPDAEQREVSIHAIKWAVDVCKEGC